MQEVCNGGAGREKLGIAEDVKVDAWAVDGELVSINNGSCTKMRITCRVLHELRGPAWDCRLLNNDGAGIGVPGDELRHSLKSGHVCCLTSPPSVALGRGVNRNEDDVGFVYRRGEVCGKDQVGLPLFRTIPGNAQDVAQSRLVDRGVC